MRKNLFAYTEPGASYPGFISVNKEADGSVTITVRSSPTYDVAQSDNPPLACCSPTAVIKLSMNQADDMAGYISAAAHQSEIDAAT